MMKLVFTLIIILVYQLEEFKSQTNASTLPQQLTTQQKELIQEIGELFLLGQKVLLFSLQFSYTLVTLLKTP
jgi:hypothetical protein